MRMGTFTLVANPGDRMAEKIMPDGTTDNVFLVLDTCFSGKMNDIPLLIAAALLHLQEKEWVFVSHSVIYYIDPLMQIGRWTASIVYTVPD